MFTTIAAYVMVFILAYCMAFAELSFIFMILPIAVIGILAKAKILSDELSDKIVERYPSNAIYVIIVAAVFLAVYLIKTDAF